MVRRKMLKAQWATQNVLLNDEISVVNAATRHNKVEKYSGNYSASTTKSVTETIISSQ